MGSCVRIACEEGSHTEDRNLPTYVPFLEGVPLIRSKLLIPGRDLGSLCEICSFFALCSQLRLLLDCHLTASDHGASILVLRCGARGGQLLWFYRYAFGDKGTRRITGKNDMLLGVVVKMYTNVRITCCNQRQGMQYVRKGARGRDHRYVLTR